jgi:hypothetical protein
LHQGNKEQTKGKKQFNIPNSVTANNFFGSAISAIDIAALSGLLPST